MAKKKVLYTCQECGYETSGWLGRCPSCNKWNTFVEEFIEKESIRSRKDNTQVITPVNLNDIEMNSEIRYKSEIREIDRVLGGGLVKGSLVLIGGDPGVGKSTLILQLCDKLSQNVDVLYVSGEESIQQIKIRADRLSVNTNSIKLVGETNFISIKDFIIKNKPKIVIIDSIQTMFNEDISSAPGSVSQVREITNKLVNIAKKLSISIIIIGHVTKDGSIAGPRVLEHMVDTVLYFEGERHSSYRIVRAVKNRYGSTNEIGIFEMKDNGLVEILNPSVIMLAERQKDVSGSVVVSSMEGTRPVLVEIQALVCPTNFGMPRRMATGVDYNRITLLIAVLEKRMGMQLGNFDAYINVVGGLKIDEPACDLGIICSIASSFRDKFIDIDTVFIGEVGLTGEVRAVSQIEKRIIESERIGFKRCVIPYYNMKSLEKFKNKSKIKIIPVHNVSEALQH
ncbi:MAG: DNA repair protein RadA [Clostridiales bacterium]